VISYVPTFSPDTLDKAPVKSSLVSNAGETEYVSVGLACPNTFCCPEAGVTTIAFCVIANVTVVADSETLYASLGYKLRKKLYLCTQILKEKRHVKDRNFRKRQGNNSV
jgi:hypothetical protein